MHRRPGFSLIELLVVIGIISIMLGLLLPTLSGARESGRSVVCASNLRQLTMACSVYAETNHNNQFPESRLPISPEELLAPHYWDPALSWVNTLTPLLNTRLLARCPSDVSPHWTAERPPLPGRLRQVSYGLNVYLSMNLVFGSESKDTHKTPRPSHTITAGELTEAASGYAVGDRISAVSWPYNGNEGADFNFGWQIEAARHHDRPQWAFLDGHVAPHTRPEVWDIGTYDPVQDTGEWAVNKFDPAIAR